MGSAIIIRSGGQILQRTSYPGPIEVEVSGDCNVSGKTGQKPNAVTKAAKKTTRKKS